MTTDTSMPERGPTCLSEVQGEEQFAQEFERLLDEGWHPDVQEFLARVPAPLRGTVSNEIDHILRERATVLDQAAGAMPVEEPESEEAPRPRIRTNSEEAFEPRARPDMERESPDGSPPGEIAAEAAAEVAEEAPGEALAEAPEEAPEEALEEAHDEALGVLDLDLDEVGLGEPDEEAESTPADPEDHGFPDVPGSTLEKSLGTGPRGESYLGISGDRREQIVAKVLPVTVREEDLRPVRRASAASDGIVVCCEELIAGQIVVRPFVAGQPMRDACEGWSMSDRARVLLQLATGVNALHEAGLHDLGLTPGNVFVTEGRQTRLLDAGLPFPPGVERAGLFSAPEQVQGKRASEASDVFSFGSLMYALLTGRSPFHRVEAILDFDPPLPRSVDPSVPEALQSICLACLARNAQLRPTSAEVADNLDRYLRGSEVLLRPVRYRSALRRQVKAHIEDVRTWGQQGSLSPHEEMALEAFHRRLLADEEQWTSVRLRTPGWFAPLAALTAAGVTLAYALAWSGQSNFAAMEHWIVPAVIAMALLGGGLFAWFRRRGPVASVLLAGGVVAALPAVVTALVSTGLLGVEVAGAARPLPDATYFNLQLFAGAIVALGLSAGAWAGTRLTPFAWTTALLASLAYVAGLVTFGLIGWTPVMQGAALLPLAGFAFFGVALERMRRFHWVAPFLLVSLLTVVCVPAWVALSGVIPGHLVPGGLSPGACGVALYGFLLIGLIGVVRSRESLALRRGAWLLELAGVLLVIGALTANALESAGLAAAGYHLGGMALLVVLASLRRSRPLALAAACGVVISCLLFLSGAG